MAGPRVPGGIAHRERDASNRCDTLTLVGAVEAGRGDLLASLAALGRSLQETFDPQRFLAEFSRHLEGLIPHDAVMIARPENANVIRPLGSIAFGRSVGAAVGGWVKFARS